ncbi:uncharacterized protein [Malus domestica]|uniref:uncharacterized protein n=1 Tax=Malus domestica TaxID=3750 RepID=UPI00397705CA
MTPINVDGNILKVKAFPFSLMDKAKDWLYELAPGTVTSWETMKRAFLEKFFSTSRVILLRKKISGIQQSQGESFPAYYERFKTLVASCPQHQMKEELLIQYFYEGLLLIERQMLDSLAGGALVDKTLVAAKILIANRALNAQQYEGIGQRDTPRQHQVNEFREQGKLPSSTIVNPKERIETANAITLRSGKKVGPSPKMSKSSQEEDEKLQQEDETLDKPTTRVEQPLPQPPKPSMSSKTTKVSPYPVTSNVFPPNVPFPSRFMQTRNEEDEKGILETFRKVHVNILLLDAIKQILKYAKFFKKLCTTRKGIRQKEVVHKLAMKMQENKLIKSHKYAPISTPVKALKGVVSRKSFEGRDQSNGKERKLTRSESARAFRRIPSSPSIILSMKKGVDCIRKKPMVTSDDDESYAMGNSFMKLSIMTIKKAVKI